MNTEKKPWWKRLLRGAAWTALTLGLLVGAGYVGLQWYLAGIDAGVAAERSACLAVEHFVKSRKRLPRDWEDILAETERDDPEEGAFLRQNRAALEIDFAASVDQILASTPKNFTYIQCKRFDHVDRYYAKLVLDEVQKLRDEGEPAATETPPAATK